MIRKQTGMHSTTIIHIITKLSFPYSQRLEKRFLSYENKCIALKNFEGFRSIGHTVHSYISASLYFIWQCDRNLEHMVSKTGWWVMNQKGSWCPSWDLNLTLLKHKWEALPLKLTCLVTATSVLIDSTTLNSVHQYGRDEWLFLFEDRIM